MLIATRVILIEVRVIIATRHAASLQTPRCLHDHAGITTGMEASIGCAAGDGMGGGIFAKTAKTPPLQSALRSALCPKVAHCRRHARTMPTPHTSHLWGPYGFYHDAAPNRDAVRCVATNAPPPYAHTHPPPPSCAYHATPHPPMSPWFYNDAARRVATVFE